MSFCLAISVFEELEDDLSQMPLSYRKTDNMGLDALFKACLVFKKAPPCGERNVLAPSSLQKDR